MKKIIAFILFGLFLITGCSGSSQPIPASEAFNTKSIWMRTRDLPELDKDFNITEMFVFEGDGTFTIYEWPGLSFSDINEMTDDEMIDYLDNSGIDGVNLPVELILYTDNTGNNAESERLWVNDAIRYYIELVPAEIQTIYDSNYAGYYGLWTKVDSNHPGFTIDDINTEGIEID